MRFLLLLTALALTGCAARITSEKMAQVHPGMSRADVQTLLGTPASIEQAEATGIRGEVDHYPAGAAEGRVIFLNDHVFRADFTTKSAPAQPSP